MSNKESYETSKTEYLKGFNDGYVKGYDHCFSKYCYDLIEETKKELEEAKKNLEDLSSDNIGHSDHSNDNYDEDDDDYEEDYLERNLDALMGKAYQYGADILYRGHKDQKFSVIVTTNEPNIIFSKTFESFADFVDWAAQPVNYKDFD